MLRRAIVSLAQTGVARCALGILESPRPDGRPRVAVLTYHRVADPDATPHLFPGLVGADADTFAAQMEFVAQRCAPIGLDELMAVVDGRGRLPARAVVVTFDDAYRDVATTAWPIARALGVPLALFVPTAFPNGRTGFWWDRLHDALTRTTCSEVTTPLAVRRIGSKAERAAAFREMREYLKTLDHDALVATMDELEGALGAAPAPPAVLDWDELRVLRDEGVTLAAHGRTHAMLDRLPRAQVRDEIAGSVADLEREVGPVLPALAYPSGRHSPMVVAAAREAGIRVAFTTERGANVLERADPLRLRRINVGRRSSLDVIRWQLAAAPLTAR